MSSERAVFIHVPRTGGTSIREMFRSVLISHGHFPAKHLRDRRPWRFAFVRDPWERAASMYRHAGAGGTGFDFTEWCLMQAHAHISGPHRGVRDLIADDDGVVLVDTVFRFEDYKQAIQTIADRLEFKLPQPLIHLNQSHPGFPGSSRHLYSEPARERITELSAWEIAEFGYEWDR